MHKCYSTREAMLVYMLSKALRLGPVCGGWGAGGDQSNFNFCPKLKVGPEFLGHFTQSQQLFDTSDTPNTPRTTYRHWALFWPTV